MKSDLAVPPNALFLANYPAVSGRYRSALGRVMSGYDANDSSCVVTLQRANTVLGLGVSKQVSLEGGKREKDRSNSRPYVPSSLMIEVRTAACCLNCILRTPKNIVRRRQRIAQLEDNAAAALDDRVVAAADVVHS